MQALRGCSDLMGKLSHTARSVSASIAAPMMSEGINPHERVEERDAQRAQTETMPDAEDSALGGQNRTRGCGSLRTSTAPQETESRGSRGRYRDAPGCG